MSDNPDNSAHPTPSKDEGVNNESSSKKDQTVMESVVLMMGNDLEQTIAERKQRSKIGDRVAWIVVFLPLTLLGFLWAYLYCLPNDNSQGKWIFVTIMFSGTYIAVVALYFALIKGMFQSKKDNEVSLTMLHQVKSLLEAFTKNSGNL